MYVIGQESTVDALTGLTLAGSVETAITTVSFASVTSASFVPPLSPCSSSYAAEGPLPAIMLTAARIAAALFSYLFHYCFICIDFYISIKGGDSYEK